MEIRSCHYWHGRGRTSHPQELNGCILNDAEFGDGSTKTEASWCTHIRDTLVLAGNSWDEVRVVEDRIKRFYAKVALVLSIFTIIYNLAEGSISIALGMEEESVALMGFGADSFVEVISAAFVLNRLCYETGDTKAKSDVGHEHRHASLQVERVSTFSIGILLCMLGVSACAGAIIKLAILEGPSSTIAGLWVSSLSLLFMFFLYYLKMYAAVILDSSTLEKDAACSLGCIQLSVTLFVSSLLTAIWPVLWWVDSVAAILLGLFFLYDGASTMRLACRKDFDGCVCCTSTNSWLYQRLSRQLRTPAGYIAHAWGFSLSSVTQQKQIKTASPSISSGTESSGIQMEDAAVSNV